MGIHLRLVKVLVTCKSSMIMEMKLTSIDYFRQVMQDWGSSWLQTLGNQHSFPNIKYIHTCILTANIAYCIILLKYVNVRGF